MSDTIYRADAIVAVCSVVIDEFDVSPTSGYEVAEKALSALPSADAVSRVPKGICAVCGNKKVCKDAERNLDMMACSRFELDTHYDLSAEAVQGEWIPVTERLPEIDETLHLCDQISDEVLGTDTYGNIRHVYLTKCGYLKPTFCTVEEGMSVDIVAWMPLPEPYKEG